MPDERTPDLAEVSADMVTVPTAPSPVRVEGADKVTGRARYTDDVRLPGMLWARALRSPHPHARILSIDASAALALSGVHAVLTFDNVPDIPWYDKGRLLDRVVRFEGDEVAVVAAESEAAAVDALAAIRVDYEVLPFVTSLADALAPGAPLVHGTTSNHAGEPRVELRGSVRKGMREADLIIDRVYTTPAALHNALEPHGCVAQWDDGRLELHASTQGMYAVRSEVAGKLGIEDSMVRVITEHMGGGFGAKQVAWKQDVFAALLARRTARPVRMMLDREAENLAAGNRNATRQHLRIGATREGILTAISARIDILIGAYRAGGEDSIVDGIYHSLYACRNVRTEQAAVHANTGPSIAFRAPGYVEGCFALESAMDELARALGIDPIELRRRNYTRTDQRRRKPYTLPEGLLACYDRAGESFGWPRQDRPTGGDGAKRRGIGFAAHDWVAGAGAPPGKVRIELDADGCFRLVAGVQDIGTGTRTILAQLCAQALGVALHRVSVALGDTDRGLEGPVSSGSTTLATLAPPVQEAAAALRSSILASAAQVLRRPEAELVLAEDSVRAADGTSVLLSQLRAVGSRRPLHASGRRVANKRSHAIRTCGAQCVEVEVDTQTGEVRVLRVVATHECGRIVNRRLADSQVIGGVTQGIGYTLMEQRHIDPATGRVLNANLEDYRIPTNADAPDIVHAALDLPDLLANPSGAKGLGESPIIPTAPAIANAIFDAVGVRIHSLPVTACAILDALGGPPRMRSCEEGTESP